MVAGILAAKLVVLTCGLLVLIVDRQRRSARRALPAAGPSGDRGQDVVDVPPDDAPTEQVPIVPRERTLLAGPPMIDGCTLRDWLVHHAHRDGVWEDVVVQFYARAAANPLVAAYFAEVDTARLQRHFLAALAMLTHTGLHRRTVERMSVAHQGVTTPAGAPITGEVWDEVVSTLVGVLLGHGVPPSAIEPLGALLGPLRAVIVIEPDAEQTRDPMGAP